MASYRVQTPKPLLDHRWHSRMYVRFAQTGLAAACLFRRSHGAVALREGSLPSSVTPRPPRRAPTESRAAWVFRMGSDDFCSCVGGPDGIASCVGVFPTQRRIPSGAATQRRFPSGRVGEIHAKANPVRSGHAATDNVTGDLTQALLIPESFLCLLYCVPL